MAFMKNDYDFVGYFIHYPTLYYPSLRDDIIGLFAVNPPHGYIFPPCFGLFENVLVYT